MILSFSDGTILHLVMKGKWFDMIERDEKLEEYRSIKPYWWKRIFTSPFKKNAPEGWYNGKHKYVRFRRGYQKDAPEMIWKLGRQGIGNAKPKISADSMGRMIILEITERIQ